jgi:hypothetical protein
MNVVRADLTVTAWDRPMCIQRHLARIREDDEIVLLADGLTFVAGGRSLSEVLVMVAVGKFNAEGPCIWREARAHQQDFAEAEK